MYIPLFLYLRQQSQSKNPLTNAHITGTHTHTTKHPLTNTHEHVHTRACTHTHTLHAHTTHPYHTNKLHTCTQTRTDIQMRMHRWKRASIPTRKSQLRCPQTTPGHDLQRAWSMVFSPVAVCCSVLQCVAACCSVLQCGRRAWSIVFSPVAVCCSVLQCVAMCCSGLQCGRRAWFMMCPPVLLYVLQKSNTCSFR